MKNLYHSLFLNNRLFLFLGINAGLFVLGFFTPFIFIVAKILLWVISLLTIIDIIVIYSVKKGITLERMLPERLSNGDKNAIRLIIENKYKFPAHISVIEELPFQFQKRNFVFRIVVKPERKQKRIDYELTPTKRGIYNFGHVNIYLSSPLQLATRKYILGEEKELKCYPSFLKLRSFAINAFTDSNTYGSKKVRRIGHSLEFEQIKEYVAGDDIRTLNWKATAKRNQLMVNQYIEEKSQPIYSIIDKGRTMQMHFDGLSLLDYSINATLAVSNAALRKQDRAGMLTFSGKVEDMIVAEQRNKQMNLISEALYNINTNFSESDFSQLYNVVKRKITNRSLLILYTNFETMDGLNRQIRYLRALAKNHLLLVVFFKNTELNSLLEKTPRNIQEVYDTIIAEKFMYEKKQIVSELKKYGIQSVLTRPQDLTDDTINKYLELKSRGLV
ncbi:DUF58 domain-containing protein [Pseudotenacibaculum sp. MALMAid0570]|uniref:DUF58 domain-containing protein n=1 Tax=Pseudotenacibaculum sp. MALMAid0570 TaxID=3143938 RepID=UPI0032E01D77